MPTAPPSAPPVLRVGLHLCLLYLVLGAILPYLPVWLREEKGLEPGQIGVLFAAISFARILAGPLIAAWSAGLQLGRTQFIVLAAGAAALLVVYGLSTGPVAVILAGIAFGIAMQTQMPLAEAQAFAITQSGTRIHFGHIRALASAFFVAANLGAGALIERFGAWSGYGWALAVLTLATLASLWLPPDPRRRARAAPSRGFAARLRGSFGVMRTPGLMAVALGAACIQAAHGFYYSFSSNLWIDQGIEPGLVGIVWSVGVVAEIVFLLVLAPRLDRLNPVLLIVAGGVASLVRWGAYAAAPDLPWVIALQTLHLATFGMTLIGTMRFIQLAVPAGDTGTAQQLVSSLVMAPLFGVATFLSGLAVERFGAAGYLSATLFAAAGLLVVLPAVRRGNRLVARPADPGIA